MCSSGYGGDRHDDPLAVTREPKRYRDHICDPKDDSEVVSSHMSSAVPSKSPSSHARVLVVDDMPANVMLIARLLDDDGVEIQPCHSPHEVLSTVLRSQPDVVLMDVRMPERDGFNVCRELKLHPSTRLIPVVLMTAANQRSDRLQAIEAGADDFVTKPLNAEELRARIRSLVRMKRFTDDLEDAEQVIVSLALTIEARDAYTEGHCQRLAAHAAALGRELGLDADEIGALHRGGFLHDVGKIAIPDSILLKPGPLSAAEYDEMRQHPLIGERLCGDLRSLRLVRPIVRHHHERLDGSGYPDGLRGDDISQLAQIVGLVDVYDALTTVRPYRTALSAPDACNVLRTEAARGWRDAHLVETFVALIEREAMAPAETLVT